MSSDLAYLGVLFALFVVPKILLRYRIPAAATSLLLGIAAASAGLFNADATLHLLANFGIVALFLFAGLEIDARELRSGTRVLAQHLALQVASLLLLCAALLALLPIRPRAAWLLSLAILTPSAGFILDSLGTLGLSEAGRFWTKSKAIAAELLALATLFIALQSTSPRRLLVSTAVLAALAFLIPLLFRLFASLVQPFAPRSEFAFLLMLALLCAQVTRRLGVYYLVGAFLVGVAARQFRARMPAISSERMLHAVEAFASIFVPFYFFNVGLELDRSGVGPRALLYAAILLAAVIPLRLAQVGLHQRLALGVPYGEGMRVGIALLPTLVFTLVLADILREYFDLSPDLHAALVIYAIGTTMIPGIALRTPPPSYEAPHLAGGPDDGVQPGAAPAGATPSAPAPVAPQPTEPEAARADV